MNHNSANLDTVKQLRESGAKTILQISLQGHRLPTWNQILTGKLKDRIKRKKDEKLATQTALDARSTSQEHDTD